MGAYPPPGGRQPHDEAAENEEHVDPGIAGEDDVQYWRVIDRVQRAGHGGITTRVLEQMEGVVSAQNAQRPEPPESIERSVGKMRRIVDHRPR